MKIKLVLFFIAFISCLSCDNQEDLGNQDRVAIRFGSNVSNFTRAGSTFGAIDLNVLKSSKDGFAVSSSGLGAGADMNSLVVKYSGIEWVYSGDFFWPLNPDQRVSFTAYAPAGTNNVTLTSGGLTVSNFIPATTITNQVDLIYAPPVIFTHTSAGADGVNLQFDHILTQVVFSVTTDIPSNYSPKILTATLTIPKGQGSFNGRTWTATTNSRSYPVFSNNPIPASPLVSSPLFMIPQGLPTGTNLSITFSANGKQTTISRDLSKLANVKTWQMGNKVIYNIFLQKTTLGLTSMPLDVYPIESYGFSD